MSKTMNIYEIEKYAQDYTLENEKELKFILTNSNGAIFFGEFLDSYMGLIKIPEISEGFIMLKKLKKQDGSSEFSFMPLES